MLCTFLERLFALFRAFEMTLECAHRYWVSPFPLADKRITDDSMKKFPSRREHLLVFQKLVPSTVTPLDLNFGNPKLTETVICSEPYG
jgi:hypothetical protein